MTPNEIQNELNRLQAELDKLKSNLSEIPNSSDHYIPQPGEVVEVSEYKDQWLRRIFIKVKLNNIFECVTQDSERYNEKYYREGDSKYLTTEWKFCRRLSGEIIEFGCDKPTQYHVAVHEAVTAEPDPYQVDWSNAPDWAELHAFDEDGIGIWCGTKKGFVTWIEKSESSNFRLPSNLDWTKSKTTRP